MTSTTGKQCGPSGICLFRRFSLGRRDRSEFRRACRPGCERDALHRCARVFVRHVDRRVLRQCARKRGRLRRPERGGGPLPDLRRRRRQVRRCLPPACVHRQRLRHRTDRRRRSGRSRRGGPCRRASRLVAVADQGGVGLRSGGRRLPARFRRARTDAPGRRRDSRPKPKPSGGSIGADVDPSGRGCSRPLDPSSGDADRLFHLRRHLLRRDGSRSGHAHTRRSRHFRSRRVLGLSRSRLLRRRGSRTDRLPLHLLPAAAGALGRRLRLFRGRRRGRRAKGGSRREIGARGGAAVADVPERDGLHHRRDASGVGSNADLQRPARRTLRSCAAMGGREFPFPRKSDRRGLSVCRARSARPARRRLEARSRPDRREFSSSPSSRDLRLGKPLSCCSLPSCCWRRASSSIARHR